MWLLFDLTTKNTHISSIFLFRLEWHLSFLKEENVECSLQVQFSPGICKTRIGLHGQTCQHRSLRNISLMYYPLMWDKANDKRCRPNCFVASHQYSLSDTDILTEFLEKIEINSHVYSNMFNLSHESKYTSLYLITDISSLPFTVGTQGYRHSSRSWNYISSHEIASLGQAILWKG